MGVGCAHLKRMKERLFQFHIGTVFNFFQIAGTSLDFRAVCNANVFK